MNKGYIYWWRIDGRFGYVRFCEGSFAGQNAFFSIDDCDVPLKQKLEQMNINWKRVCPAPDGALCVTYTVNVLSAGDFQASDVREVSCN